MDLEYKTLSKMQSKTDSKRNSRTSIGVGRLYFTKDRIQNMKASAELGVAKVKAVHGRSFTLVICIPRAPCTHEYLIEREVRFDWKVHEPSWFKFSERQCRTLNDSQDVFHYIIIINSTLQNHVAHSNRLLLFGM